MIKDHHAVKHINTQIKNLFQMDDVRLMEILESVQFGLGYLIVGFFIGTILDYSFPNFDDNTPVRTVFLEVLFQSLAIIVLVFYVRKLVKIMPSVFDLHFLSKSGKVKFRPYTTTEYSGELMISLAIIGAQFHLIRKLDFLSKKLYEFIYKRKRHEF